MTGRTKWQGCYDLNNKQAGRRIMARFDAIFSIKPRDYALSDSMLLETANDWFQLFTPYTPADPIPANRLKYPGWPPKGVVQSS
jgi:hypothetical protein